MNLDEFSTPKGKINEGKMAELDIDLNDKKMSSTEFVKKYKHTRAEMKSKTNSSTPKKKVKESDEVRKTSRGATITKTPTGFIHKGERDDTEHGFRRPPAGPGRWPGVDDRRKREDDVQHELNRVGKKSGTDTGLRYTGARNYSGDIAHDADTQNFPIANNLDRLTGPRMKEATGDEKFDKMLGTISNSQSPQSTAAAASSKVNAKANKRPDDETIEALNKMMYDMHVTMQTANRLMQKLMSGR